MGTVIDPVKAPMVLTGLSQASAPVQINPVDSLRTLAAEIDLVRQELYLGHWDEAKTTLGRVRQRLVKVTALAGAWPSPEASELLVVRAVSYALAGRVEDTIRARGAWLFERAADLFAQVARRQIPIADAQRTDWAVALAHLGRFEEARNTFPTAPEDVAAKADIAFALGRAYARYGMIDEARDRLECAAALDLDDPWIHAELGRLRQEQGESGGAAKAYCAAARAFERQGRHADAYELAQNAAAAAPGEPESQVLRIELLLARGEPDQALCELDALPEALRLSPALLHVRVTVLIGLGRDGEALQASDQAVAAGDASTELLLLKAFSLLRLDRPDRAVTTVAQVVDEDAQNAVAHAIAARAQLALGDDRAALGEIERAIALASNDAASHVFRAALLRLQGRLPEAVEAATAAVNLVPEGQDANLELGRSLIASGRYDEARRALSAATAGKRRNVPAEAFALLGHAYVQLGRHDDATKKLRVAVRKDPDLLAARDELAFALLEMERPREALREIDQLIERATDEHPGDQARRLTWRGEALRLLQQFELALEPLERAYELAPDNVYTLGTLGQVRAALGDADGAAAVLTRAAEFAPPKHWVVSALVDVLAARAPEDAIAAVAEAETRGLGREDAVDLLAGLGQRGPGARLALDRAVELRPDWVAGLTARALATIGTSPSIDAAAAEKALADADHMLAIDPSWVRAAAIRSGVLTALGRTAEARAFVDEVLEGRPTDESFLKAKLSLIVDEGDATSAEAFLREVIGMPDHAGWAYEALGSLLYRQGRLEDALGVLDRTLEIDATESVVQLALRVLNDLGRPERVIPQLRRAIDRNQDSAWLHGALAERLWLDDDNVAALEEVQTSIDLEPADASTRALHGAILAELDQLIEALVEFERAVQIEPDFTWARGCLGHCLCELGEFREAIPVLTRALNAGDAAGWMRERRAWARRHCGYLEGAFRDYEIAADGHEDDLWNRKGAATCLSFMEGRRKEAEPRFRDILARLESSDAIPAIARWSLAGWCDYRLGELDDAVDALTQAVTADPLEAAVQFDLALAMLCAGHTRKARAEYRRGLDLARPDVPRSAALVRVALSDLREAGRERPELTAVPEFATIQRRLQGRLMEARRAIVEARKKAADA